MGWNPFRSQAPIERVEPMLFKSAGPGAATENANVWPILGAVPSATGMIISQTTAMSVSAVYACVSIRAEDTARCTPRLYKPTPGGGRDQVKDHPVARLLYQPNAVQTWFEFCSQMEAAVQLRSNAYAAIKRDRRGQPEALIPINPDYVTLLEAPDGGIFYQVTRVGFWLTAMLENMPPRIPAEDMLHLKGLSFSALLGASKIHLARDNIGLALGFEQQSARWMKNGARPSVLLKTPKTLTDEAAARLKTSWTKMISGVENTGETAILEEGLEPVELQLTAADLDFLEQRNFQVEDIARLFRVPPHKLARTDGLRGLNLPQADQEYVNDAIMPACERWEQKLAHVFNLDPAEIEVDLDESNLLRADITTRYNAYRIGIVSGFIAPNEPRRAEKLPPVAGGDDVRFPVNTAVLGSDTSGTAPDGAGKPADGELPADAVPTS